MEVREIAGDGFSQLEFSQNSDTPDPRIGGSKIIFDSRLSDVTKNSETSDIDAFYKVKAEQKEKQRPKLSELETQKLLLQKMMEEKASME